MPIIGLTVAILAGCSGNSAYLRSENAGAPAVKAAPNVQDLVGARGSSGEMVLERRGYEWIRTIKDNNGAYSFWLHRDSGQCIAVRTEQGRYVNLLPSPASDCRK